MTQEQKARAYDEALKMAKVAALNGHQNLMEGIFPELCENKDERIRKGLIGFLEDWKGKKSHLWGVNVNDILAWLEKLKVFAEHGDGLYLFGNNGFTYVCNPIWDNSSCLEKQGEQKSAWSEDYTKKMGQIINYLTCQAKEESTRRRTLLGWVMFLKSIFRKGLPEIQIPCTEAARKGIHRIMDVLEWAADKGRISDSDCGDYMILLSAYLPQQKSSWSEEDEQHIDSLLKRLDGLCRNEVERTRFAISEDEDWLKSLKQRYT